MDYTPKQPQLSDTAMAARHARDKRDGLHYYTHASGLCGGYASLCGECYADELAEYLSWAAQRPRPIPGEDIGDYWRRIGGRFGDAWYEAASAQIRAVAIPA